MLPNIEAAESTDTYGRFIIQPLEEGFAITLGNALRRVLFSSLPGAAVTWVKIEGVQHEFSTIPHMKEDATEFLLNVKALRLCPLSDRPGKLTLEVSGEGVVSAADIQTSADFAIVNPELHLATLDSPESRLIVEFNVELGKGYVPVAQSDGLPIGVIPVDAIFSPVRRVNHNVEPTRVGQKTNYERLTLEVWTDGAMSAVEAVSQSAKILVEQFSQLMDLKVISLKNAEKEMLRLAIPPEKYNMPVEQLNLSVRTLNCLRRGNISTVGELVEKTPRELMALRNFGQKSMAEVQERLRSLGLTDNPLVEGESKRVTEEPTSAQALGKEGEGQEESAA